MTPDTLRPAPTIAWAKTPLFFPLSALIAGILYAHWSGYPPGPGFLCAAGCCLLGGGLTHPLRQRSLNWGRLGSCLLLIAFFAAGAWRAADNHAPNDPDFFAHRLQADDAVGGRVTDVRRGDNSYRLLLEVETVGTDTGFRAATGKLLVYVPHSPEAGLVRTGDRLLVREKISALRPPPNPGMFDGRWYWANQGVYHRTYAYDPEDWRHLPAGQPGFRAYAKRIRTAWFHSFERYLEDEELAVAAALVMGKKDLLSTDTREAYANTGALHVLAVSGLHVGIILLLVKSVLILVPGRDSRFGRWLETGIALLAIWIFAVVSGLSPSVERAAIMFSIVACGRLVRRRTYLVNTLAAAALLMLWWAPRQLFQVGFQLSFCALLGIIWFAPALQRALPGRGKIAALVKGGLGASVGAQAGTLPVSLYTFGLFPAYFFVSGSAVVLFAYGAMAIGVLHGLLYAGWGATGVTGLTGQLLAGVVGAQNAFIHFFDRLPGGVWEVPGLSVTSACLLAGGVLGAAYAVHVQSRRSLVWAALFGTVGLLFMARTRVQGFWGTAGDGDTRLIAYHIRGKTLIDYQSPEGSAVIGDSLDARELAYGVAPARRLHAFVPPARKNIDGLDHFSLGPYSFTVLREGVVPVPADYLLVRRRLRPWILCGRFVPETTTVVVDGSVPAYLIEEWIDYARANHLAVWVTGRSGAFVLPAP